MGGCPATRIDVKLEGGAVLGERAREGKTRFLVRGEDQRLGRSFRRREWEMEPVLLAENYLPECSTQLRALRALAAKLLVS